MTIRQFGDKLRSSEIRKSLNVEPLLLRIERSQLRWFTHVSRISQERLSKQVLLVRIAGKRPIGRPRTRLLQHIESLDRNRLGPGPNKLKEVVVVVDRDVWRLNLEMLPRRL